MNPLDVLKKLEALERRVSDLEQRRPPAPSDSLQPNVLVIRPDGTVGAVFPGGVQLFEETSSSYSAEHALGWLDSAGGGQIREFIMGFLTGVQHALRMLSQADPNDAAEITLTSVVGGVLGDSAVIIGATDSAGGVASVTAIDSMGQSNYLQLGASEFSAAGSASVHFPGGAARSNVTNIHLAGASGVCEAVISPQSDGVNTFTEIVAPDGAGGVNVQLEARSGGSPPAENVFFAYLIWGF